jgi:hypothetical protein
MFVLYGFSMIYHFFDPLPQDNFTRLQTYMAKYFNHDDREYTIIYKCIVSICDG